MSMLRDLVEQTNKRLVMDGWMDGWIDGWMDGWPNKPKNPIKSLGQRP